MTYSCPGEGRDWAFRPTAVDFNPTCFLCPDGMNFAHSNSLIISNQHTRSPPIAAYYITINIKSSDPAAVRTAITALFTGKGFSLLSDEAASLVVEDEDKLPEGEDWYGAIVSGATKHGWVSVYVDDWADSGLLAKGLSAALSAPVLEVWVAEDIHWGYTYYENGAVLDRFADDPAQVIETPEEAALYAGQADILKPILRFPSAFDPLLQDAQSKAGQFAGEPLDGVAAAVGLPFEHLFTGYDYFFDDDPEDYADDLEQWPEFRHLAFQTPPGRETLAE